MLDNRESEHVVKHIHLLAEMKDGIPFIQWVGTVVVIEFIQ